ncbi:MAG: ribosomal protein S18-alanine N-acetyltransferase [Alphaproteobacteria bacterium]
MSDLPRLAKRRLTAYDSSWLAVLHCEAFASPWTTESFFDLLVLPTTLGWVLTECGRNVGFILYQLQTDEAQILTFQIAKASQQRGFGRYLLSSTIDSIKAAGARSISLEVAEQRTPAQKLYESLGFILVGRRKSYYKEKEGRVDALVYSINLTKL